MDAIFTALPPFARYRADSVSDDAFRSLQNLLMQCPSCGDVIQHTGGLHQIRVGDACRPKGKRGGSRVIYDWWQTQSHFLLFTIYGKGEVDDLSAAEREILRALLTRLTKGR